MEEDRLEGEVKVTLRLLNRRCGPLSEATTARIQTLPLDVPPIWPPGLLSRWRPPGVGGDGWGSPAKGP
jgi:hypothetical protein